MINNGSNLLVDGYCWKRVGCETNLSRRVLERPSRFCESPAIARRPCVCARVYGLLTQRLRTRRSPALIGTTRRECYSARRASFAHTYAHICTCAHTHTCSRARLCACPFEQARYDTHRLFGEVDLYRWRSRTCLARDTHARHIRRKVDPAWMKPWFPRMVQK